MRAGFAFGRSADCDSARFAGSLSSAQAQRKGLPDKRPGTAAGHVVVVWSVSPCQTRTGRAEFPDKPLIFVGLHRAKVPCPGSEP